MSCGCNAPKPPLKVVCCPPKRDPRCCKPVKPACPPPKPTCQPPRITKPCSCQQILEWQKNGRGVDSMAAPVAAVATTATEGDQIIYRDVMY